MFLFQIALNISFCIGAVSFVFSISFLACSSSSSLIISSLASSMPRCVYVFIVTLMSEWPIRYCSVLGFIPALCNHFNKRLEPCSFCNKAGHCLQQKSLQIICFRPCYGYEKNKHGELVINEHQAQTVKLIFDLYQDRNSILGIIKELHSRLIPSPTGKLEWCKRSVENILTNEKYCGNVIVSKTYTVNTPGKKRMRDNGERKRYYAVGSHPAIITQEQFDLV